MHIVYITNPDLQLLLYRKSHFSQSQRQEKEHQGSNWQQGYQTLLEGNNRVDSEDPTLINPFAHHL